jgi:hypothetical protein
MDGILWDATKRHGISRHAYEIGLMSITGM